MQARNAEKLASSVSAMLMRRAISRHMVKGRDTWGIWGLMEISPVMGTKIAVTPMEEYMSAQFRDFTGVTAPAYTE